MGWWTAHAPRASGPMFERERDGSGSSDCGLVPRSLSHGGLYRLSGEVSWWLAFLWRRVSYRLLLPRVVVVHGDDASQGLMAFLEALNARRTSEFKTNTCKAVEAYTFDRELDVSETKRPR